MNHLEIEYKTMLDKEEYQSLLPLFADTELVVQTNHYIDTCLLYTSFIFISEII